MHTTQFEGRKFHPYRPSKDDSVCKQTSASISYLGFPKFIHYIISSLQKEHQGFSLQWIYLKQLDKNWVWQDIWVIMLMITL